MKQQNAARTKLESQIEDLPSRPTFLSSSGERLACAGKFHLVPLLIIAFQDWIISFGYLNDKSFIPCCEWRASKDRTFVYVTLIKLACSSTD